ncbi:DUF6083 domain-containing protein [Streptomyces sp. AM8-1-1]|uniref:DUF6083 domain-containing protein n=1 Tax=Streptomyces sp. AM8-1-1 TaxID=3075825 RepID=UPI0028C44288|nr:DUF6083 domain-containing protein [Streptomyces sp. AM8-1-1]WNO70139.1 DUF6083 domain-containing protein [Streptomyces sp. AM8-1-1]WNO76977.1 DUF6083 domain-containing protein [Streptomyces sp. AM8-1-1]
MRSTTTASSGRRWDGSPTTARHLRALRIAADSPSRLLRTAQPGRCHACGNRIDWYTRTDHRSISLHPAELRTATVPAGSRWHVAAGIAHPGSDGTSWCRIPHLALCPRGDAPAELTPLLTELRRHLALSTRRLLDSGTFTPTADRPTRAPDVAACRPTRPVVQILYGRYLAAQPVEDIRCIAQTRRRERCPHPVLAPDAPAGRWTLMPATPASGQLALPAADMAIYSLSSLPYAEQLRWRAQRCPAHAAAPAAADLALADWEVFDPLVHHQHLHPRTPTAVRRRRGHA